MSKKYKNPPIVEALCEFQFIPGQPWDMTIPGLLYEKVRKEFPIKNQTKSFDLGFQTNQKNDRKQELRIIPPRMQYLRKDKTALIQVSENILTVNHLKPYPTWEKFKPLILDNLNKYKNIAKPKGFKRIGLRYINIININEKLFTKKDYFNYYPSIPDALTKPQEAFNLRVEIPYKEGQDRLVLITATLVPEKKDTLSLLLDLDYFMNKPDSISLKNVSDWLEDAHTTIEKAFEESITNQCRALFK